MICLNFGQEDGIEIDGITVYRSYRRDEGIPMLRFLWPRLTKTWSCLKRVDADIYYQRCAAMLTGLVALFCKRYRKRSIFAAATNDDFVKKTSVIRFSRDRWIYEYGLRHVDRILVQNHEQATICRENFGLDSTLVPNLHPGPVPSPPRSGQYILWVSMFHPSKRPDLLLDLAEALPTYQFRMVGGPRTGQDEIYEAIRTRALKLENVEFIGFVPYARVDEHFDGASLFVNTSEIEGFPNAFLQAWVRGIPTVSMFDCGARMDGKPLGRVAGSFEEMVVTTERMMGDDIERVSAGERCRMYVAQNHCRNRILNQYEQVFDDILTGTVDAKLGR